MKKILNVTTIALVFVTLAGCFLQPNSKKIEDYWVRTEISEIVFEDGALQTSTTSFFNEFDQYFSSLFMYITTDSIFYHAYDPIPDRYGTQASGVILTNETLSFVATNDTLTLPYILDGDKLTMMLGEYDDDNNIIEEARVVYQKYSGTFPPESWSELQDDDYEPDVPRATKFLAGATFFRNLTDGDEDFFGLAAFDEHNYLLKVRSKMDLEVSVFADDSLIVYDDNNDTRIPNGDALTESMVRFVSDYDYDIIIKVNAKARELGYYEITIIDEGRASIDKASNATFGYQDNMLLKKYLNISMIDLLK